MDLDCTQMKMNPSPAAYTVPSPLRQSPKFSVSQRVMTQQYTGIMRGQSDLPAPVSYNVPSPFGDVAQFSLASRTTTQVSVPTPAPNVYKVQPPEKGTAKSLAGREHMPHLEPIKYTPSPNAYSIKEGSKSPKFTVSGRTAFMNLYKVDETAANLAPNSYTLKPTVGDAPSFSIKIRKPQDYRSMSPGPGAYDVEMPFADHGLTMGLKAKVRGLILDGRRDREQ